MHKRAENDIIRFMKVLKNHKKKIIVILIMLAISAWCISCETGARFVPDWKREDISEVLEKEKLCKEDYNFLFAQTGLGKDAIDDLIKSGKRAKIYEFSEQYFEEAEYKKDFMLFPFIATELKTESLTEIAPLRDGDILISLTTYTMGYRHGHAGIVVDAETGTTVEHTVFGERSDYGNADTWRDYTTFAVLRYKDSRTAKRAAEYAEEKLLGIFYTPLAGFFKKDKQDENPISSSMCSHLVWQAYVAAGADIDGDGGNMVMPSDFLKCPDLEIVQIYGIDPKRAS